MFGYRRDDLIGRSVDVLVLTRFKHVEHRRNLEAASRARPMGPGANTTGRRKDGTEFPLKISLSAFKMDSGEFVIAAIVDQTAQELAKNHISEILGERDDLRRRLMQAQERERERLARDLHDQTGQIVAAAMMDLKALEPLIGDNGRSRIHSLRDHLGKMSQALHRIAQELRPAAIDEVGLIDTLTAYVAEWSAQFGIVADFFCGNKQINQLSDEVSTTIYRIAQEALTNIVKHAKRATSVNVFIDLDGQELRLTIQDNGCGFDMTSLQQPQKGRRHCGLGLDGMHERLSLIGGDLEIESTVGAGTGLFVRIPLERERMVA